MKPEATKTNSDLKRKAEVLGPSACMWAAKLSQRNWCLVDAAEMKAHQGKGAEPKQVDVSNEEFRISGDLLSGGQGKSSGLIYDQCDSHPLETHNHVGNKETMPSTITDTACLADSETVVYAGLNQPRLQSSNNVVLGEDKKADAPQEQATPTSVTGRTNSHITMDTTPRFEGTDHTYRSYILPAS